MEKSIYELIAYKRDGGTHTSTEIQHLINAYMDGQMHESQMAAWLMAVYLRGMTIDETAALTEAMARSGDIIRWSQEAFNGQQVLDKHSSGGVGDKTTLIVLPIVASLGIAVAKLSGRGLGHTGGTVDKLESIPGCRTDFNEQEILTQLTACKLYIGAQTANLAPADKKLYALRNTIATIESVPLIASSILSKKFASGADAMVFDIKVGNGAFMKTEEEAAQLAETMRQVANNHGKEIRVVLSNMDQPLGRAVGNALEVKEAYDLLSDASSDLADLRDLCVTLAAEMLQMTDQYRDTSIEQCRSICDLQIKNKQALRTFEAFIQAQHGDLKECLFGETEFGFDLYAEANGIIDHMDTQAIGYAANLLGAANYDGKTIDPQAGLIFSKKRGDSVFVGERLVHIRYDFGRSMYLNEAVQMLQHAIVIKEHSTEELPPIVYQIVRS